MKRAVARMAINAGFEAADNDALETVLELYSSLLQSIAETTKSYSELGSRTMPLVHDVVSATTELGINLDDAVQNLTAAQRNSSQHYPDDNIQESKIPENVSVKNIAERKLHEAHINESFPPYPEPHTYINSSAVCRNAIRTEFEEVKEAAVDNVRDSQSALAKFSAKMELKLRGADGTINLIPNDEATCVVTPVGSELHDCKAINITEETEWVAHPKTLAKTENATNEQLSQNPYVRQPKRR